MGYCYTSSRALCCDNCGTSGGVRKRPCPYKWCQAPALCAPCNTTVRTDGRWHRAHVHCEAASAAYKAECAVRDARLNAGESLRAGAMGYDDDATGLYRVRVLFDDKARTTTGYDMSKETYDAIPLGAPASVDDYRAHGPVVPAPNTFTDCHAANAKSRAAHAAAKAAATAGTA